MAEKDGIGSGGVLFAFVAGALVGAAAALLLAPASGEETRDYLEQQAKAAGEKARDAARQAREMLDGRRGEQGSTAQGSQTQADTEPTGAEPTA